MPRVRPQGVLDLGSGPKLSSGRDFGIDLFFGRKTSFNKKNIMKANYNRGLPFKERTFKKITSDYSLDTFGSLLAYKEANRVLEEGGKIEITSGSDFRRANAVIRKLKKAGFEKIETKIIPLNDQYNNKDIFISAEKQAPLERASMRERPSMREDLRLKNLFLEKNILKETNVLKQNPIEKNILRERQVQKQRQVQKEKLIFKPVNKTPPPRIPRVTIPKIPTPIIPRFSFNLSPGESPKEVPGYLPFVIKNQKKVYIGPIVPRGKALSIAERRAKETLRATFGAEKTGLKIREKDINFKPEKKFFRSFRIKQGKKIPLKDTFIQKLGKRLSFRGEVQELQAFRMAKR
jgi:hypothetical protein